MHAQVTKQHEALWRPPKGHPMVAKRERKEAHVISTNEAGAPIGSIALLGNLTFLCYGASGLFTEVTKRNSLLKDLQIAKELKELADSEDNKNIARNYQERVFEQIGNYAHGRNISAVVRGILIRGVPWPALAFVAWFVTVVISAANENITIDALFSSLLYFLIGGFTLEGIASLLRPWTKPLSKRWDQTPRKSEKRTEARQEKESAETYRRIIKVPFERLLATIIGKTQAARR